MPRQWKGRSRCGRSTPSGRQWGQSPETNYHSVRPWQGIEDVEFTTPTWAARYDSSRLLEPLSHVPLAEFERAFHSRQTGPAETTEIM